MRRGADGHGRDGGGCCPAARGRLAEAIAAANATRKLAKTVPSEGQVAGYIEAAKAIEPLVTH